eukprot:121747-Amphidinium_carterae.1
MTACCRAVPSGPRDSFQTMEEMMTEMPVPTEAGAPSSPARAEFVPQHPEGHLPGNPITPTNPTSETVESSCMTLKLWGDPTALLSSPNPESCAQPRPKQPAIVASPTEVPLPTERRLGTIVQTENEEIVSPVAEHHYRRCPAPTSPPEMPVPTDIGAPTSPVPPSPLSAAPPQGTDRRCLSPPR